MTRLIRAEIMKLSSVRSTWWLAVAVVAFATLSGVGLLAIPEASEMLGGAALQTEVLRAGDPWLFAVVLGALIATGEHRHGTVVASVLVTPQRWPLLPAKAVVAAAAGALLTLLAALGTGTALGIWLASAGEGLALGAGEVVQLVGRAALFAALMAVVGLGVGEAVRSQPLALVVLLVGMLLVSPLLLAIYPNVGWWLPAGLELALLPGESGVVTVEGLAGQPPFGALAAAGLLTAYAAVAVGVAAVSLLRREAM